MLVHTSVPAFNLATRCGGAQPRYGPASMCCSRGLELLRVDAGAFPEVQLLCQGVAAQAE